MSGTVLEKIKTIGIKVLYFMAGVGTALLGAAVYIIGSRGKQTAVKGLNKLYENEVDENDIDEKAEKVRVEAERRIRSASAADVCNGYGGACDAIAEGKVRFTKRCKEARDRNNKRGMAEDGCGN